MAGCSCFLPTCDACMGGARREAVQCWCFLPSCGICGAGEGAELRGAAAVTADGAEAARPLGVLEGAGAGPWCAGVQPVLGSGPPP